MAGQGERQAISVAGHDGRWPALWRASVAAAAGLTALLLNLLLFHNYPLLKPETLSAWATLVGIALIYGALYSVGNRWVRAFLEGLLIAVVLDGAGAPKPWPVAAGVVVLAFTLWRRRSILKVVTIVAAVAALSGLLGIGQQRSLPFREFSGQAAATSSKADLPAIVHIILDEHVGLDAMPADNPRTPAVRAAVEHFYIGHGFRLYSRPHSDYAYTLNSVPQLLNFGEAQEPGSSKEDKQKVKKTAYLDILAKQGRRVNVYQSEFLDLCRSAAVARCFTYDSQHMEPVVDTTLSTGSKTAIILRKLTSPALRKIAATAYKTLHKLGVSLPDWDIADIRMNPLNASLAFDRFNRDLASAKPGDVYFAHILLPHSPFGLTADCRVKEGWWTRRQQPGDLRPRQDAGYDQLLCALKKTQAAYEAISRSAAGKNFVMIVHGDHGSRTTDDKPTMDQAKVMTDAEKLANFSTLFAVRAPGIASGLDRSTLSLATLLTSLARSDFRRIAHGDGKTPTEVYLDDNKHVPRVRIRLPQGW